MSYRVKQETIRADLVLTAAYVYTTTYGLGVGKDQLSLLILRTAGDATTIEICVQFSDTSVFTTAYVESVTNPVGDGTELVRQRVYVLDASSPVAPRIMVPIDGLYCRVGAKATGGTPTDTLEIKARCSLVEKGV